MPFYREFFVWITQVIAVIQDLLDNRIRPSVQMDGGDIQFKSFKDGVVKLEFHGACGM